MKKKEAQLMTSLKNFSWAYYKNGATQKERDAVIKTARLVEKYLPFYQKKQ